MKYRFKIVALLLFVSVLTACGGGISNTDDFSIISTKPSNNATNVSVDTVISITLSSLIEFENISQEKITLQDDISGLEIEGDVTVDGNEIKFTPTEPLRSNVDYRLRVARDFSAKTENQLVRNFSLSFKTELGNDKNAPSVDIIVPEKGEIDVVVNTGISVTFDEPIKATSAIGLGLYEIDSETGQAGKRIEGRLSPTNNIITYKPNTELLQNTEYVVILKGITDDAGNLLNEYSWKFVTGGEGALDTQAPSVVEVKPSNDSINVPITRKISAGFSENMDASTLTSDQFTLTNLTTGNYVIGSVQYNNLIATFVIAENNQLLESGSKFEAKIENAKDLAGNSLEITSWVFTNNPEDKSAPEVVKIDWKDLPNGSGVAPDTDITILFSKILLDETIFNSISLSNGVSGESILQEDGKTIVFTPSSALAEQTEYVVIISESITDENSNSLKPLEPLVDGIQNKFETGDITSPTVQNSSEFPTNGALAVAINATISIGFSESLYPTDVENYLSVTINGNPVAGNPDPAFGVNGVSVIDDKIRFTPKDVFPQNTLINVVANKNIKDLAGNTLVDSFSWSFTSGDTIAPEVNATNPVNEQFFVSPNASIFVNFLADELIDVTTVTDQTFFITNALTKQKIPALISVNGSQMSLKSVDNLAEKTLFTVDVTEDVADASGQKISAPYSWLFTTDDKTSPAIETRSPIVDATDVEVQPSIIIELSERVLKSTITSQSVILQDINGNPIASDISTGIETDEQVGLDLIRGVTSFALVPLVELSEQTLYTIKLTSDILDLYENNMIDEVWSFTTGDFTPPTASITSPNIDFRNRIKITPSWSVDFSESVNPESEAFSLVSNLDASFADLNVIWNIENTQATLSILDGELNEKESYTFSIDNSLLNDGSNILEPVASQIFIIGDFTDPTGEIQAPVGDELNRVSITPVLNVIFDEAMVQYDAAFILKPALAPEVEPIPISVTWNSNSSQATLSLISGMLEEQFDYTLSVETGIVDENQLTDVTGNPLQVVSSLTFRVGDFTNPVVNSFEPSVSPVAKNSPIQIAFSEILDPASLLEGTFTIEPLVLGEVAISENLVTFTQLEEFASETNYTVRLTSDIKDLAGNSFLAGETWSFTSGDFVGPTATINQPEPPEVDSLGRVSKTPTWKVTFSESIRLNPPQAIPFSLFETTNISNSVPLNVSWNNQRTVATLSLISGVLGDKISYTSTVDSSFITDNSGNALTVVSPITFEIGDFTAPVATINAPVLDNLSRISVSPTWSVDFSEPVVWDNNAFSLVPTTGGSVINLSPVWNTENTQVVLSIAENVILSEGASYQFSINNSLIDDGFNALATISSPLVFVVGDFTDPTAIINLPLVDVLERVSVNPIWTVIFDEPVQKNNDAFSLKNEASHLN